MRVPSVGACECGEGARGRRDSQAWKGVRGMRAWEGAWGMRAREGARGMQAREGARSVQAWEGGRGAGWAQAGKGRLLPKGAPLGVPTQEGHVGKDQELGTGGNCTARAMQYPLERGSHRAQ